MSRSSNGLAIAPTPACGAPTHLPVRVGADAGESTGRPYKFRPRLQQVLLGIRATQGQVDRTEAPGTVEVEHPSWLVRKFPQRQFRWMASQSERPLTHEYRGAKRFRASEQLVSIPIQSCYRSMHRDWEMCGAIYNYAAERCRRRDMSIGSDEGCPMWLHLRNFRLNVVVYDTPVGIRARSAYLRLRAVRARVHH